MISDSADFPVDERPVIIFNPSKLNERSRRCPT
jgi:hypothetical protein